VVVIGAFAVFEPFDDAEMCQSTFTYLTMNEFLGGDLYPHSSRITTNSQYPLKPFGEIPAI
jgi:hypothetical protein